ncbi:hypothetical protein DPMN_136321 [Dreissena polymorpha]|uniref:Core-binding (CB) domain-containing protein n=1 Tax=Dreissena polymorpha TaxID=45954 RepID=A0A9D4G3E3_DREPO|nr:hypothetical protein DPMN_136321 [Dreissena polymorpha]
MAAKQTVLSLADSTLSLYKGQIRKYLKFCEEKQVNFADNSSSAITADFLCHLADSSERPETLIKTTLTAVDLLLYTMGLDSPTRDRDVDKLVTALMKSSTKQPMKRQRPLPVFLWNFLISWDPTIS